MRDTKEKGPVDDALNRYKQIPGNLIQLLQGKIQTLLYTFKHADSSKELMISKEAILELWPHWERQLQSPQQAASKVSSQDEQLIRQIRLQTNHYNANNVIRTRAYLEMYQRYPELHWAFLAHMVSRNAGWTMTDLKGDLLPHLLDEPQTEFLFQFLERANALIFQDAYPQLLLYQESRRLGRPLFHLLPELKVSAFMLPIWEYFWKHKDAVMLTTALIINEQNYIEGRVVQNSYYKENVMDTLMFKTQSLLQLNQVVFPYVHGEVSGEGEGSITADRSSGTRLAGLILEDFGDLHERIEFGKKLYAILFGLPVVQQGAFPFALRVAHTGSRADYWPELFVSLCQVPPETKFRVRLDGCKLKDAANPLFSPKLEPTWKNRPLEPVEPGDWFRSLKAIDYLAMISVPFSFDMTTEYYFGLHKIELAILAKQELM